MLHATARASVSPMLSRRRPAGPRRPWRTWRPRGPCRDTR